MNYELLRIFKFVAYYGSISAAAKKLFVTQPSVTKSIKKLEQQLDVILFVREKKGMALTDEGKRIYRYVIDAINTLDNVESVAKKLNSINSGILKIGAGNSITETVLSKTIIEFKKIYPNITIEIKNSSSDLLYNDLRYGRLDLVFINSTIVVGDKYKKNKVIDIEDCFFTSPTYNKKIKKIINLNKILEDNLIVQNERYDTRIFLNNICLKNNIQLTPCIEVDRHSLLVFFVKCGMGIGFATKQYIQRDLDSGELIKINVKFDIEKRYVNAVYRNNNDLKVEKFIELLNYNMNYIN